MSEPITDVETAVRELGALPVPAGTEREPLSAARLAEIRDLLKYESSIAFYSHRAKESMLLLVSEAEAAARLRRRVAELETGLPAMLKALLRALDRVAELEQLLAEYERPADEDPIAYALTEQANAAGYPPALPWAKLMDADDLEGFLADLADAASGDDDLTTLTEVESAIARWRAIGEAQHAHNTAPGPNAEAGETR